MQLPEAAENSALDYIEQVKSINGSYVSSKVDAIPDDVLNMKEMELEELAKVDDVERRLRAAWALEMERALRTGSKMEATNIYKGIISKSYFERNILFNTFKLAYIIRPFPEYEAEMEDMLQLGLSERKKILKRPLVDNDGKFDHKLAALKEQITKNLEERRRGAVMQRLQVDQKSLNVNVTKDVTHTPLQLDAIDARLRELESSEAIAIEHREVADAEREV